MMGPQWLCDCNASGSAATVAEVEKAAAQHFLDHGDATSPVCDGNMHTVSIYKERNDWLYDISEGLQAVGIVYPLNEVDEAPAKTSDTTLTTPFSLPVGATVEVKDSTGSGIYTVLSSTGSSINKFTHTVKKAEAAARDFTHQWKVGEPIELGNLTLAEANAQLSATVDAMLSAQNRYRMVAAARHLGT